ncbi:MAG: hypothetical protein ACJA1I_001609 [Zhongshania marina]|jgi:hypothetical protein
MQGTPYRALPSNIANRKKTVTPGIIASIHIFGLMVLARMMRGT